MKRTLGRAFHSISKRAKDFVHRHMNPCGEMVTFKENAKVPDGALPNSAALELREVFIVRCPGLTDSSIPVDSGDMWTLTVIHTPMFRTPLILVANTVNSEMSDNDRILLARRFDTAETKPTYPLWDNLATGLYWTTVEWTALVGVPTPTNSGGTTAISQFRIASDGMTIYNNTPDIINQGMVIGAQFNCEISTKTIEAPKTDAGLKVTSRASLNRIGTNVVFAMPLPSFGNDGFVYTALTTQETVTTVVTLVEDYIVSDSTLTAGETMTIRITRVTGTDTYNLSAVVNRTSDTVTIVDETGVSIGWGEDITFYVVEGESAETQTQWQLPPTDTRTIMQDTPKAVYMSMKEQNGVYMVKRVFQPVFSVQSANSYKRIHMIVQEETESEFLFGPRDTFDLNFGVGVVVMTSIPKACAPAFKLIRDIEIVAGENSIYGPIMSSNEGKEEAALEIVKQITTHHPFMYPESYNVLGTLGSMLTGLISKVPLLGNVTGVIGNVVKGLLSPGTSTSAAPDPGLSQNRLASTNCDELAKTLSLLLQRIGL